MTPEGILKQQVGDYLKARPDLFVLRIQSGRVRVRGGFMHLAPAGTSDYLVFWGISPGWIELKVAGQQVEKKRRDAQAAFRDRVLALGHRHVTAYTLDQVIEFVNAKGE